MATKKDEKLHLPSPSASPSPWLVYTHGSDKHRKIQTFCTISPLPPHNESYIKSIPALRGKEIIGSSNGWYILLDFEDVKIFSLWNPITMKIIALPPLEAPEWEDEEAMPYTCVLTSPPESDAPVVVLLLFRKHYVFSYHLRSYNNTSISNNSGTWATQRLKLEGKVVVVTKTIVCNGVIYAVVKSKCPNGGSIVSLATLGVIDNDDDKNNDDDNDNGVKLVTLKPLPLGMPRRSSGVDLCQINYLVESCGVVYVVSVLQPYDEECKRISFVMVWALDLNIMNWVQVDSLDDRAFFIDQKNCSTWCWATSSHSGGIEGNCVYFLAHDECILYLFRLEDSSLTTLSKPCQNLATPWYEPNWVMLQNQSDRLSAVHGQKQPDVISKVNILDREVGIVNYGKLSEHNTTQDSLLILVLPVDVLAFISTYLHLNDFVNFRVTCKRLLSALPDLPQQRGNTSSSPPLFMFSNNEGGLCKVLDPCRKESCSVVIPMLSRSDNFIDYSKNDWLVFGIGTEFLQYYNPFTRVEVDFPPFDDDEYNMSNLTCLGFSTCPTSFDCVTVGILKLTIPLTIAYFVAGEETWEFEEFDSKDSEGFFWLSSCGPVYLDGIFYFLNIKGNLGAFELVATQASWRVYDRPKTRDTHCESYHLVECGGELLCVSIGYMGIWVQVFRFELSTGFGVKSNVWEITVCFLVRLHLPQQGSEKMMG